MTRTGHGSRRPRTTTSQWIRRAPSARCCGAAPAGHRRGVRHVARRAPAEEVAYVLVERGSGADRVAAGCGKRARRGCSTAARGRGSLRQSPRSISRAGCGAWSGARELVKVRADAGCCIRWGRRSAVPSGTLDVGRRGGLEPALLFFNPFGEYVADEEDRYDEVAPRSFQQYIRDARLVERWLLAAPRGTAMVTYNGLGRQNPGVLPGEAAPCTCATTPCGSG